MEILDEHLKNILDGVLEDPGALKATQNRADTIQPTTSGPCSIPEQEVCPKCHNSGWDLTPRIDENGYEFYVECDCGIRQRDIMDSKLKFASLPDAFQNLRLYQFDLNIYQDGRSRKIIEIAFDCIRCWLDDFDTMSRQGKGLFIFSQTKGSGKTRIVASLANELIHERGMSVKFTTSTQIINEIKRSWDRYEDMTESKLLDDLARTEVLVIDDFGTEKSSSQNNKGWVDDRFNQVLNERYANKKITLFTSNYSVDDLPYDDRIISRIKERAFQIPFPEESVREHLAKKDMNALMERVAEFQGRKAEQMSMESFLEQKGEN